jgi:hypothetical protein
LRCEGIKKNKKIRKLDEESRKEGRGGRKVRQQKRD